MEEGRNRYVCYGYLGGEFVYFDYWIIVFGILIVVEFKVR